MRSGWWWVVSMLGVGVATTGCFSSSDSTNTDAGTSVPGQDGAVVSEAGADATPNPGTPDGGASLDGSSPPDGGAIAACTPGGAPVMHTADIVADETWSSGIHLVPSSIQIKNGARLTVAACSEVRLALEPRSS